ncbi:DUF4097 family beta strand repeat-containing protein [Bacillus spongiae]|uniref:DUF4097 family beta strand repeat-containing protein n=1 Tax=Bacillus spongiae TaxID=2683610 RepID=A0ABU8HIV4_9BACI
MALKDLFSFKTVPFEEVATVEGENLRKIMIEGNSSDIDVIPGETDSIEIKLSGEISEKLVDSVSLKASRVNDTLMIEVKRKHSTFQFGVTIQSLSLEVQVPQRMYESLFIYTASGDISVHGIEAKDVECKASSGDIKLKSVNQPDYIKLSSSSGDILLADAKAKKLKLKSSSGSIVTRKANWASSTITSSSGEIDVDSFTGQLRADSSSGDIQIYSESLSGDLDVESSSGSVNIEFLEEPQSVFLDYKASSGEGDVQLIGMDFEEKKESKIVGTKGEGQYSIKVRTSSGDFSLKA